jgi:hypothetical protein
MHSYLLNKYAADLSGLLPAAVNLNSNAGNVGLSASGEKKLNFDEVPWNPFSRFTDEAIAIGTSREGKEQAKLPVDLSKATGNITPSVGGNTASQVASNGLKLPAPIKIPVGKKASTDIWGDVSPVYKAYLCGYGVKVAMGSGQPPVVTTTPSTAQAAGSPSSNVGFFEGLFNTAKNWWNTTDEATRNAVVGGVGGGVLGLMGGGLKGMVGGAALGGGLGFLSPQIMETVKGWTAPDAGTESNTTAAPVDTTPKKDVLNPDKEMTTQGYNPQAWKDIDFKDTTPYYVRPGVNSVLNTAAMGQYNPVAKPTNTTTAYQPDGNVVTKG